MSCPTLVARPRTEDSNFVIPVLADERTWLTFGEALEAAHAEQEAIRHGEGITGMERDAAGFAAKGLELAVEAWNDTTEAHRGSSAIWGQYTRMVQAEIDGGWSGPVRAGLTKALLILDTVKAQPVAAAAR